jgi:hypothetical protein
MMHLKIMPLGTTYPALLNITLHLHVLNMNVERIAPQLSKNQYNEMVPRISNTSENQENAKIPAKISNPRNITPNIPIHEPLITEPNKSRNATRLPQKNSLSNLLP